MADLSSMYRLMVESIPQPNDMMRGAAGMQQVMGNGLEYQQARDNYEAMRGLRALFAKNANPSMADVGAISPAFAQEYGKNQFAMQRDLLGMQRDRAEIGKIEGQVTEQDAKAWAPIFGSIAEKYADGGNIEQFRAEIGQAIAQGQAQGLRLAPQFDINSLDPLTTLQRAQSLGYRSQYLEAKGAAEKEQAISGVAPRPKPEQYYGEASIDPATAMPMRTPPVVGPGAQPGPEAWQQGKPAPRINGHIQPHPRALRGRGGAQPVNPYAPVPSDFHEEPMTEQDVEVMRQEAERLPPGPKKNKAMQLYEQARRDFDSSLNDEPDERFASSGEIQKAREQKKRTEEQIQTEGAKAREVNKLAAEDAAAKKRIMETIALFPSVSEVESLLKKSTSGPLESKAAQLYSMTGRATPGMEAIGSLRSTQELLQQVIAKAQGDPTLKEVMIKAGATGNLADPEIPWNERLSGYKQFIERLNKQVEQIMGGKPSAPQGNTSGYTKKEQELIDAHKAGTLTDEQFKQQWDALPDEE